MNKERQRDNIITFSVCILILSGMVMTVILSKEVAETALGTIIMCGKVLIPAIFPFTVASRLLVKLGFADWMGRRLERISVKLFRVGGSCFTSVMIGLLCGFPAGAASAKEIYDNGLCNKEEFEKALVLSSSASPGFVISAVGAGLFGSVKQGVFLYILQLTVILILGSITSGNKPYITEIPLKEKNKDTGSFLQYLSSSVSSSAMTMVGVCGTVIFFSIVGSIIMSFGFIPEIPRIIISSLTEITSGSALCAEHFSRDTSFAAIAGLIGWNGVSVHAQTALVTDGKASLGRYLSCKALSAVICAVIAYISLRFCII